MRVCSKSNWNCYYKHFFQGLENEAFAGGGIWNQDISFVVKDGEIKCCKLMDNDGAEGKIDARESGRDWEKSSRSAF